MIENLNKIIKKLTADKKLDAINVDKVITKIKHLEEITEKYDSLFEASKIKNKAKVNEEFEALKANPYLSCYGEAFYWSMLNLFLAHGSLTTNIIKGSYFHETSTAHKILEHGIIKGLSLGDAVIRGITLGGGLLSLTKDLLDDAHEAYMISKLKSKAQIIKHIIINKCNSIDEVSVVIQEAALKVTEIRKNVILNLVNSKSNEANETNKGIIRTIKTSAENTKVYLTLANAWNQMKDTLKDSPKKVVNKIRKDVKDIYYLPEKNITKEELKDINIQKEIISYALKDIIFLTSILIKNYKPVITNHELSLKDAIVFPLVPLSEVESHINSIDNTAVSKEVLGATMSFFEG